MLSGLRLNEGLSAEIGPLHNPLIAKSDGPVLYVDHCETQALRAIWSKDSTVDVSRLHVDVVWRAQTFEQALRVFALRSGGSDAAVRLDHVVASHVVEHVPDLIGWLQQIRAVLKPDGQLRLAVPDRRFTFDHRRRTTTLAEVLAAHVMQAQVPSAACILDHTLNMIQVDCAAAWRGEIDAATSAPVYAFDYCVRTARDAFVNGSYHDFHCWVFTPTSFLTLLKTLAEHDLNDFCCDTFFDTGHEEFEFIVHLTPCPDRQTRVGSWQRALSMARRYSFAPE